MVTSAAVWPIAAVEFRLVRDRKTSFRRKNWGGVRFSFFQDQFGRRNVELGGLSCRATG